MLTNVRTWTVLFALSLPAAAGAQEHDPDSVPARREYLDPPLEVPHDPFDLGVKNIGYSVGLKLAGVFDDNVFLSDSGEEADFITVILLSAESIYRREETEARLSYHGRERLYADNDDLDGMEHFVDASGTIRLDRFRFGAGVEWRERKDTFDPLEIREPVDSRFDRGYVRAGMDFNKIDFSLTADLAHFAIDDSFHDRGDFERVGLSLMASARPWPQAEAFGEVLLRTTDYDEGAFSDFSYLRIAVGARGTFSANLRGMARIGFGSTDAEDPGVVDSDDFSGPVAEALIVWDADEKHDFHAGLIHAPAESVVTGLALHQGIHVGWVYRMMERLTVRSSIRWSRASDPDGDFERTGLDLRAGARWDSGGLFYMDGGILLRSAQSDETALEYDNLRVSLGLGVQW